jgi:2'-5' RNA ligase
MRTFIALELPSEIKNQLSRICTDLQIHNSKNINWVIPQNLHITLLFIGDIEPQQKTRIAMIIQELCSECPSPLFTEPALMLITPEKPHLLWIEYKCYSPQIKVLYRQLQSRLQETGCRIDNKPLRYHVTLGRVKGYLPPAFISDVLNLKIPPVEFKSNTVTFYQSILRPQGPEYISLFNYSLL